MASEHGAATKQSLRMEWERIADPAHEIISAALIVIC